MRLRGWSISLFAFLALAGCAASHGMLDDAGTAEDGGCGPMPFIFCVDSCGSDAGYAPICSGGAWVCPPGTRDATMCPPTCVGAPPGSDCVCVGTEWQCDATCPPDVSPGDPSDPHNACAPEGAECSSEGGPCGAGLFCTCRDGRWECAIADPDPVCFCGRQPHEGDPCLSEGAMCGECCPEGGVGWPAMICSSGHWTSAVCPADCPVPIPSCPADTSSVLGQGCFLEGAQCGDPCCDDAIVCEGGVWRSGPVADCLTCNAWECGDGVCHEGEHCRSRCGPTDGIEYVCDPSPSGCSSCDCLPLGEGQRCEMIDGRPQVSDGGLCG